MDNTTSIKVELELHAQRIISQYMFTNENIKAQVEAGVRKAFENFNVEKAIEEAVTKCIEKAIKDSSDWGKIRDAVKKETDLIVDQYIQKSIDQFRENWNIT